MSEHAHYAEVILDISTRSLTCPFSYEVPPALVEKAVVGATVLVTFGGRKAIGYIVNTTHQLAFEPKSSHSIKAIESVLAPAAFDRTEALLGLWMADEYAASPASVLRLFLAPGQKVKVMRVSPKDPWELVCEKTGAVDERMLEQGEQFSSYVPKPHYRAQIRLMQALAEGPQRLSELRILLPSALGCARALEKKGVVRITKRRLIHQEKETTLSSASAHRPETLTDGQKRALDCIQKALASASAHAILLDGVTGSGKTEVYLEAIETVIKQGKQALVLVPEISLTAQTLGRFRSRFPGDVCVLHSKLSIRERFDQWDLMRNGTCHVLIGARSACFAPLYHLGIIVVDEEHDSSYKQELQPRYDTHTVVCKLAQLRHCPVVFGSATPSLEMLARAGAFAGDASLTDDSLELPTIKAASQLPWHYVEMPERTGKAQLPHIHLVDMAQEFNAHNRSMFSYQLKEALFDVVKHKQKALLLLNRRGFANFLLCRACGFVPECPHCSLTLSYHESMHLLICHGCERSWSVCAYPNPLTRCPACASPFMAGVGVGTERVELELERMFGDACTIVRMDADTTSKRSAHQELLERFDSHSPSILVGTQMIAKGLDFPELVLVGVLNADTSLKMCNFRAQETTYQLLEQVSGRAGRGSVPGDVYIQSYEPTHPVFQALQQHKRCDLMKSLLAQRCSGYYPPYARLCNVLMWSTNYDDVLTYSRSLACAILQAIQDGGEDMRERWHMLGPSDCLKRKLNDRFRRHILIKAPVDAEIGPFLKRVFLQIKAPVGVAVAPDIDPLDIM